MRNYASPVFQHRHYALIAKALSERGALDVNWALADMFERDNPKFDRQRFLAAARGEPNGKDKR
jgi:hypothetical protein